MSDRKVYELIAAGLLVMMWVVLGVIGSARFFVVLRDGGGIDLKALALLMVAIPTITATVRGGFRRQVMIILWMVLTVVGFVIFYGGIILQVNTGTDLGIATLMAGILTLKLLTIGGRN